MNKGSDKSIRFSVQSIGINTLSNRMKDLFQAAGILLGNRNSTNHSGKVTCCITLFNAGFSDSSVKPRSGHRSRAVETYTRPLEALYYSVSHSVQPPKPTITASDTDNTATSEICTAYLMQRHDIFLSP